MSGGVQPAGSQSPAIDVFANTRPARVPGEPSFQDIFLGQVGKVQSLDEDYQKALEAYLGGADNEDQVAISFRKKQFAFNTLLQIRNKLVEGFDQLMQMRV